MDEPPPGAELGLDADGTAGSDAFGLLAKKGGRGLLSGGDPMAWYRSVIEQDIFDYLNDIKAIRARAYRVQINIWLTEAGGVEDIVIVKSTGDVALDNAIERSLLAMGPVSKRPPPTMQQPMSVEIIARI